MGVVHSAVANRRQPNEYILYICIQGAGGAFYLFRVNDTLAR